MINLFQTLAIIGLLIYCVNLQKQITTMFDILRGKHPRP